MSEVIQLEPVELGTLEEEEERLRRLREAEAATAAAAQVAGGIDPIMPPQELSTEATEAQRLGDANRGTPPAPTSEYTHPTTNRAGRIMPPAHVLRFDEQSSPPAAAVPPSIPPRQAAASPAPSTRERLAQAIRERQAKPDAYRAQQRTDARAKAIPPTSQADHTGADVSDAVRRPLHILAAGFRGAQGRRVAPFRSAGDASRQREREQQAGKAERGSERRAELDASADRRARREDASERTASLDAYRQQMAAIRERESQGLISQREAVAEYSRTRAQMMRDQQDPQSAISEQARADFVREINMLPEPVRQSLGQVDTSGMSAAQIENMRDRIPHFSMGSRGVRSRGGSRRRGGGARARANAPPEWYDGTAEDWGRMTPAQRGQETRDHLERQREGGAAANESPVPGLVVTNRTAAGSLNSTAVTALRDEVVDYRNTQRQLADFERLLNEASIAERAGNLVGTSPVMRDLENLQRQLALGQRSILGPGAITDQEREVLMQLVPSIDLIRSSATARRQLATMRRNREARFTDYLDTRGFRVDPNYSVGGAGGGQPRQRPSASSAERVQLYRPDGSVLFVAPENVEEAIRRGATRTRGGS